LRKNEDGREDRKYKLASPEATLVPFDWDVIYFSENTCPPRQKRTIQPEDAFEDTAFKPGF
jgi:hypothetical protein